MTTRVVVVAACHEQKGRAWTRNDSMPFPSVSRPSVTGAGCSAPSEPWVAWPRSACRPLRSTPKRRHAALVLKEAARPRKKKSQASSAKFAVPAALPGRRRARAAACAAQTGWCPRAETPSIAAVGTSIPPPGPASRPVRPRVRSAVLLPRAPRFRIAARRRKRVAHRHWVAAPAPRDWRAAT